MKIILLLPDGVGIRNFLYTDFLQQRPEEVEVTLWCESALADLLRKDAFSLPIQVLPPFSTSAKIETLRKAKQTAELLRNARKFENPVYKTYLFSYKLRNIRQWAKWALEQWLLIGNISDSGVQRLKNRYLQEVRKTDYYRHCKAQLESDPPDLVFCTHQRASVAIAPLLAAQDLAIPTASFIFSWDNLPKGTLTVAADHYLVWSSNMLDEMQRYYPDISEERIHVTGTPQFVPYFDASLRLSRTEFCRLHGMDPGHRFICFSGDDITTSPHDPLYLKDLAEAVQRLNTQGTAQYRIVFRRCPADWSDRYDAVLESYKDIIHVLDPVWKSYDGNRAWNHFIPDQSDVALLINTALHCDVVVNVGSTMAIDFATLGKPACYIRYDAVVDKRWSARKVYNFIHFQTMQGLDPVYWIDRPADWLEVLPKAVSDEAGKVSDARRWQAIIAAHPLEEANQRIWKTLGKISSHAHLLSERGVSAS